MLRFYFFGILLFISMLSGLAQPNNQNYPVQFSQFMYDYSMINPASIGVFHNNAVMMGYQRPVTGFTGVSTYFCTISFLPYKLKAPGRSKSITGVRFYNDNEGAYINRMRFYGMYAFHTKINGNLSFAGGIDFGGMNFAVKATPNTEGASVFKADANTGIWLYNEKFHAGFSVNQIFNSVFQPLEERTELPTYFSGSASYVIMQREYLSLTPHVLFTYPYYGGLSIQAGICTLLREKFLGAVSWNYQTSISVMLGVNDIEVFNSFFSLILSYNASIRQVSLGINQLELSMSYAF